MATFDYHEMTDFISTSMLKDFMDDPTVYFERYITKSLDRRDPSAAMELGSVVHAVLLDQRPLRSVVYELPDHDPLLHAASTLTAPKRDALSEGDKQKIAKLAGVSLETFLSAKGGKPLKELMANVPKNIVSASGVVSKDALAELKQKHPAYEYFLKKQGKVSTHAVRQIVSSVRSNERFHGLFGNDEVIYEQPIFWEADGLKKRCCPDGLILNRDQQKALILDLKVSANALDFERSMNNFRYWVQEEHYRQGVLAEHLDMVQCDFLFICVQSEYPYHVTTWMFDPGTTEIRNEMYHDTISDLQTCYASDDWSHPLTKGTQIARFFKAK